MKRKDITKTALLGLLIYTTHKVTLYFEKQRVKKALEKHSHSNYRKVRR